MAKDQKTAAPTAPTPTGVKVGGGIITASMPSRKGSGKPTLKRGVRVGGGIITANMP